MARRLIRIQRRPVFFGCEGESEAAYRQLLYDLLRAADLPFHIHIELLAPGAGDPLARVQRALRCIPQRERQWVKFHNRFILMDDDQALIAPQRAAEATRLAAQHAINVIWQTPSHEALLLRHMPDCSGRRPVTANVAESELKKIWPEYEKPMSRANLSNRIGLDAVQHAAEVEPELRAFLQYIRLVR